MDPRLRWIAPVAVVGLFGLVVVTGGSGSRSVSEPVLPPDLTATTSTTSPAPQHGPAPSGPTTTTRPAEPDIFFSSDVAVVGRFVALQTEDPQPCTFVSGEYPAAEPRAAASIPAITAEVPSWTAGVAGTWLAGLLSDAGVEPRPTGSAFIVADGIDGVVYAWLGPPGDEGPMLGWTTLVPGVQSAQAVVQSFWPANPARPVPLIDSAVGGGARLWFLTQPRAVHDAPNFGLLPPDAPCLPTVTDIRLLVAQVAAAADAAPFTGTLPVAAGAFNVPSGGSPFTGVESTWLGEIGREAFGSPLPTPGSEYALPTAVDGPDVSWVFTRVAPHDTDPAIVALTAAEPLTPTAMAVGPDSLLTTLPTNPSNWVRVLAGGRELAVWSQDAVEISGTAVEGLLALAVQANRDPFLGQPYVAADAAGLTIDGMFATITSQPFVWWVRVLNSSEAAVDLTGWELRDDIAPTHRFPFPDGFTLEAGAAVTLWYRPVEATGARPCGRADREAILYYCNAVPGRAGATFWNPFLDTVYLFDSAESLVASRLVEGFLEP